jgi:flagellar hook-associated protein 3 FlgL
MRVTESMIFDENLRGLQAARDREQQAVQQTSSGVRVTHPGDDPAAAGQIVLQRLETARAQAIGQGVAAASSELNVADASLNDLSNLVVQARQIAMQLANSNYSASDRAAAAEQVQGMIGDASRILNAQVGGRYIFGGDKDGAAPFDPSGNYAGDASVRQIETAPGVLQDVSVRADVMVKGAGGGVDLFATLQSLQSALTANDPAAVSNTLGALDSVTSQVALGRAQVGTQMNALDAASQAVKTAVTNGTAAISQLADADVIDSASKLAQAQQALDAALTATSKSFGLSLVDKLG